MKKITLLLTLVSLSWQGFSQIPVTDAAHITTTTTGFMNSLMEAVKQTGETLKILENGKRQFETLNAIKKNVEEVNRYVRDLMEVKEAAEQLYRMTEAIQADYKAINSSGKFSVAEARDVLDSYTSYLTQATRSVKMITEYISKDEYGVAKWMFNDAERRQAVIEEWARLAEFEAAVKALGSDMRKRLQARKDVEILEEKGLLSPVESYHINMMPATELTPGMELKLLLKDLLDESNVETMTESQATAEVNKQSTTYVRIFYAISALMGLLGGLRVYQKVQLNGGVSEMQDSLPKSIWLWFSAAILLLAAAVFTQEFFY